MPLEAYEKLAGLKVLDLSLAAWPADATTGGSERLPRRHRNPARRTDHSSAPPVAIRMSTGSFGCPDSFMSSVAHR
jgi:hypothetical protein